MINFFYKSEVNIDCLEPERSSIFYIVNALSWWKGKDDVLYMNVIANACMFLKLNIKDHLNRGSVHAKHFHLPAFSRLINQCTSYRCSNRDSNVQLHTFHSAAEIRQNLYKI